jgi:hypothetical protein
MVLGKRWYHFGSSSTIGITYVRLDLLDLRQAAEVQSASMING